MKDDPMSIRTSSEDRYPGEPTDLDLAILDRLHLNVCPFGPLTRDEHDSIEAYERHIAEVEEEQRAFEAAGNRSICPQCGNRSVRHGTVCTLGYPGHPGAEFSAYEECETETCDYKELA